MCAQKSETLLPSCRAAACFLHTQIAHAARADSGGTTPAATVTAVGRCCQAEGKDGPGQGSVAASGLVAVAVAVAGKVAVVAVARRFACSGRYVMVQTGKPVGLWRAGAGRKQKLPGEKEGEKGQKKNGADRRKKRPFGPIDADSQKGR